MHSSPWDFSNSDPNLISPDGNFRIEFLNLDEIAMGGPLGGECYLVTPNGSRILVNDWSGMPIVWNESSNKIALPVWTMSRDQRLAIADLSQMTLSIYSRKFRVLKLESFEGNLVQGHDSPIHRTESVKFDIEKERIESITPLEKRSA